MRVVALTDIITPYVAVVMEAMSREVDFTAVFCSSTGTRGMDWNLDLSFRHEIISGLTIRRQHLDATDYYLSPGILAALRRARPDAVISSGYSVPTLYAAMYCRARRIPLILQSDGTAVSEACLGIEQRVARELFHRVAWGGVANSRLSAERLVEIGFPRERVFTAPHTIRIDAFWEVADARAPHAGGALRLLCVGRFIPRKGTACLIEAVSAARTRGFEVELTLVGAGPEEADLRRLADRLSVPTRWLGFVDQHGLPAVYADADVFCFPTLDDPFGIVLIEAAAAGLPLIASPYGGATQDLVREGVNGFVVDPNDTAAMAVAITRLAGDDGLRRTMGAESRAQTAGRTPHASARVYLEAVAAAVSDTRSRLRAH
jgi:glycosyltransferase involved in cell wall biosynthesis